MRNMRSMRNVFEEHIFEEPFEEDFSEEYFFEDYFCEDSTKEFKHLTQSIILRGISSSGRCGVTNLLGSIMS